METDCGLAECLIQVGDEVIDAFDTDAQTHEVIRDAKLGTVLGGDGCVGHNGGMLDEGLDAAE